MDPNAELQEQEIQEFTRSLAGKSKAEAAVELKKFASSKLDANFEQPVVHLSDEQLRMVIQGGTDEAKKAAAALSGEYERKYDLSPSDAKARSEQQVFGTVDKHKRLYQDYAVAAKTLRAIHRSAAGRAKLGELDAAYDEEKKYMRDNYGRETLAMSLTTDSSGGYLASQLYSDMLYENISRQSHVRKHATILNMGADEIIKLPKLTASVTVDQVAEGSAGTTSQPTFGQFTLQTKKLMALSKPFAVELMEKAHPALVPLLIKFATIEIMKKEDSLVFGTTGSGILASSTNLVTFGSAITATTFDHMSDLEDGVDEQYIPDEDIQGSDIIGGEAAYWFNKKMKNTLVKSKGDDNYHWASVQETKNDKRVHGYPLRRVLSLPSAPASGGTKFGCFGNLGYVFCGVTPGYLIEVQTQGTVDGVNLNETAQMVVRVIELFDNAVIDDEAFAIAQTA